MPEVVEAETVANWNLDQLLGRWPEMVFDKFSGCHSLFLRRWRVTAG
jgi:hypothetical protein